MPSFQTLVHKFFRSIDLFPTSKLLRYNGETDYTTTTGGICSAAILTILVILFATMGLKTLKKQIINSSISTQHEADPSETVFTTDSEGDLMLALYLGGFDLNSGPKLFDFYLYQESFTFGNTLISREAVPLVQCTLAHFNITPDVAESYTKLNLSRSLCPSLGQQFTVKGKRSGEIFNQLRIVVSRCNSIDSTCVNDSTFAAYQTAAGMFTMVFALINTNINPTDDIYRQVYIDDRNIFSFNSQLGISLTAFIQSDTIQTDQSLTPFTDIRSETVTYIPDILTSSNSIRASSQIYATIEVKKSTKSVTYYRSFNKLDTYLSYVGGLVGTLIGLVFFMGPYTEKCYEISLAKKLMVDNNHEEIKSELFNIFGFLIMGLKKMLTFIGCDPEWQKPQKYIESSQQLAMQIDVTYIVRKLMFLDAAISKLMEKHEIQALCLREKPTIKEAKQLRRTHFAVEILAKHIKTNKDLEKQLGEGESFHDNVLSNIVEQSPSNLFYNYAKEVKIEDASALELSQKQSDIDNIKQSVGRVIQEGKAGKQSSINILKGILPSFLQKIIPEKMENKQNGGQKEREKGRVDMESINASNSNDEKREYDLIRVASAFKQKNAEDV